MSSNIQISENRLWDSLNEMALIGATQKGGVNRQTLTDLDKESRDLFIKWCHNGPTHAHVSNVLVSDSEIQGYSFFDIIH